MQYLLQRARQELNITYFKDKT